MDIRALVCVQTCIFNSLGYITRSRIVGSFGYCAQHLEELSNCFPTRPPHFTFPPECMRVPISAHLHKHLLLSFNYSQHSGRKWYLVVILSCIFLMNDDEYFFMFLLVICVSSLEKCLLKSFAYQKT